MAFVRLGAHKLLSFRSLRIHRTIPVRCCASTRSSDQTKPPPKQPPQSSSSSKLSDRDRYTLDVLNADILEKPKPPHSKYDIAALSEDEHRLYRVVQHLIDEGFIDEQDLLALVTHKSARNFQTIPRFFSEHTPRRD